MKRRICSIFTFIFVAMLSLCVLAACKKEGGSVKATVVETTDTMVVIRVDEVEGDTTLLQAMEELQKAGELSFTLSGTMVTGINGKANDADYDPCWMLYTSDTELANTEWGTVDYDGKTFGSAIVGAEALTLSEGAYYVWCYKSF